MTIQFDKLKLEDEAATAALDVLKGNEAFTNYVTESVAKREDAVRKSVMSDSEKAQQTILGELEPVKKKLAEFRENNVTLKKQLESFDGFDPDEYKKLKALGSDANKAVAEMQKLESDYKKQLEALQGELSTRDAAINDLTGEKTELQKAREQDAFRFAAVNAIQNHNANLPSVAVRPKAVRKLIEEMANSYKQVDGELIMLDNGREFTTDSGVGSMEDWIDKVARRELDYMFETPTGGGALGNTGATPTGPKQISRKELDAITDPVKKSEAARTRQIVD